jgi:N-acetylmuramic acid 6-phosphate etherase
MLKTEAVSSRYGALEDWTSLDLVEGIAEGQFASIASVHAAREAIAEVIERAAENLARGGRLFYVGAGTSGRIATQDAAELPPTFNWPHDRVISIMAGGEGAINEAAENAEDSETEAAERLDAVGLNADDVVIGLAASGRTPFTIAGLVHARAKGALTIGIHNNAGARLGQVAEIEILLDTGPEILAGSTRMKAGTAQKVALNCISTGVMIRLGYVYKGLMIEMRPSNEKLRHRAADIVARITGADQETAKGALERADYSIKHAVVMVARSMDFAAASAHIDAAGGNLRKAME